MSRIVAAVIGGYALANISAVAFAHLIPGTRVDQVMTALPLSFVIFCAAVIWVFAARSATRAWIGLAAAGIVSCVMLMLLR